MWVALVIFLVSYVIISVGRVPFLGLDRPSGALLGALAMVLCGVVTPREAVGEAVNYDTLLLLLGMMVLSGYLSEAQLFRYASWITLTRFRSRQSLLVALVFVSGLLSAVLVNDTICLMLTPLVLQLVADAKLPPRPFLLALAFGANAGSVATPTGNPQNMIIGTLSGVSYARFVVVLLLPALVSLAAVSALLLFAFREHFRGEERIESQVPRPEVQTDLALLSLLVLGGVVVAFLAGQSMPWTALTGAGVLMMVARRPPRPILEKVDWVLLIFFAGLFVVTYGVGRAGLAERLFDFLRPVLGDTARRQMLTFGGFTVLASQLVSNVPFVLLSAHWMPHFQQPPLMWVSLALFSTLAGNLTAMGSVANLIVLEGAGPHGRIGFFEFLRIGALVTFATLVAGSAVLLAEHGLGWI